MNRQFERLVRMLLDDRDDLRDIRIMVTTDRSHHVARLNPGLRARTARDNRLDGGRRAEKRQAKAPQRILF